MGRTRAVVLAVTSGKGGVGKTSLCVNLATELARTNRRVVVVDADLGLANTHILAGLRPEKTLCDYLENRASLPEVIQHSASGVKFISGGSGIQEMANLDERGRDRIRDAVRDLRPYCDVIMLDTGAGVSRAVTDFVALSDHALIVTTANFAAIADAYGIIKVMVQEGYTNPMHLIVNRVRSPEEADQVWQKLKGCSERFLKHELNWLGLLPEDQNVEGAVVKRAPFCEVFPDTVASKYLKRIVAGLERYLTPAPTTAASTPAT